MRHRASLLGALLFAACGGATVPAEPPDPPETVIGERLFRETRFAQFFFANEMGRGVNRAVGFGDPVVDTTVTTAAPLPGAYFGLSMNCAACHLVDEQLPLPAGGMRTYTDFAPRSPIPERGDGRSVTPRNSPPLVNASIPRDVAEFFHFDGEFATLEDLVRSTLTGRNFGWLPTEQAQAIAHIARVVREDDGSDANAEDHGGKPYHILMAGPENILPRDLLLRPDLRIDVFSATDEEVVDAISRVIAEYVRGLIFAQNLATGLFNGSPYDRFLAKNGLPQQPDPGESALEYARRLRSLVDALAAPKFVGLEDGRFALHNQAFDFGPLELAGFRVFFGETSATPLPDAELLAGGRGGCIRCHAPPAFTDFRFHNVGVAQAEFDAIHGDGAFAALPVPTLAARDADPDAFLPPSPLHPDALGPFLAVPALNLPGVTDLGLWNVFRNPDVPIPQPALRALLLEQLALPGSTTDAELLPLTIAWFKTPGLRDLSHGSPHFHNGAALELEDVVAHYGKLSGLARDSLVRNPAPELLLIALVPGDRDALVAFLKSLNEDYG